MNTFIEKHIEKSDRFLAELKNNKQATAAHTQLPVKTECWSVNSQHSGHKYHQSSSNFYRELSHAQRFKSWKWPKRTLFFISDPHADPEAFVTSLLATGGVKLTGSKQQKFELTKLGKKAVFIIGGDCLDKGPDNLGLLDKIKALMDSGARVKLLAGNHDMRLYMGIHSFRQKRHPATEHLFVRMGDKALPLLTEIYQRYFSDNRLPKSIPNETICKQMLFPREEWFDSFPQYADALMTQRGIERELGKMRRKYNHFEQACQQAGFSMRHIYAIAMKCQQLFFNKKGKYYWFFDRMQLSYKRGSFLFLHAGLDDGISHHIHKKGIRKLNKDFRKQIKKDLFTFYYGSIANTMRTKYRDTDLPLTTDGVEKINRMGIHAVVQGHINRTHGQRLVLKQGLLHIEGDVTLDRNSRHKEGLKGYGVGFTVIHPDKRVIGMSNDYPYAKAFNPEFYQTQEET